MATQRRHVAVAFVDLSGFTALVDTVQPEVVYQRVRPLMDELVVLVSQYGGEIQQVLGDGFMAVFGLDTDHESSPEGEVARAVRAGIALVGAQSDGDGRLPVHVGIECGQVLVSPSWEPARFAVWGRAVTVAKRLCDLAGPGMLHIGPHALRCGAPGVLSSWGGGEALSVRTSVKGITGELVMCRVRQRPAVHCGSESG